MSIEDDIKQREKELAIVKALRTKWKNTTIGKIEYIEVEKVGKNGKVYKDYKKVHYILK